MNLRKILTLAFASLLAFNISCNNDNDDITLPQGQYENGILVANEGNFNTPNASISYISKDLAKIENNIYSTNNSNENLGDVLQCIGFKGNNAYLVLNNTNKVVIVNRYTMKKQTEITSNLVNPRYIAFSGNYIYVTNDAYGGAKYVSIYNATDNSYVKKIDFTDAAQRVVEAGGNIFVQNASYGNGNKISLIKTSDNTLQSTITIPNGNIKKIISDGASVYAIASGAADSYIYQISNTGNITKTTTLTGITNASNIELYNGNYYFSSENKVYTMPVSSTTTPSSPLITVTNNSFSTLYGFNVVDGKIFTSDANNFTQDSKITVYSTSGTVLNSYSAGRSTNGFYAN